MEKWVSVYISKNIHRTEIIKNEMISRGINAVILSKIDSSYPMLGTAKINVPEKQADLAMKIVEEFDLNDKESQD